MHCANTNTCGSTQTVNLYNASALCSPHSSTTCRLRARQQASPGTREMRLSDAWCYDGQPFDPLVKAVDGSDHTSTNGVTQTRGRGVSSSPRSSRRGQSFAGLAALLAEGCGTLLLPTCFLAPQPVNITFMHAKALTLFKRYDYGAVR